jgi:hypothetical protein
MRHDLAVHTSNGLSSVGPDATDGSRAVANKPVSDRTLPHPRLSSPLSMIGSRPS